MHVYFNGKPSVADSPTVFAAHAMRSTLTK